MVGDREEAVRWARCEVIGCARTVVAFASAVDLERAEAVGGLTHVIKLLGEACDRLDAAREELDRADVAAVEADTQDHA